MRRTATVRSIHDAPWERPPHHDDGALSKMLVRPDVCGAVLLDYRISSYRPGAGVPVHHHDVQEQIYHLLEGHGLMTIGDEQRVLGPHDLAYFPAGVKHGIVNTGLDSLVFLVITAPAEGATIID
jgi:mannose-6-phosphate isomerase-like protein (cupin superfamily)